MSRLVPLCWLAKTRAAERLATAGGALRPCVLWWMCRRRSGGVLMAPQRVAVYGPFLLLAVRPLLTPTLNPLLLVTLVCGFDVSDAAPLLVCVCFFLYLPPADFRPSPCAPSSPGPTSSPVYPPFVPFCQPIEWHVQPTTRLQLRKIFFPFAVTKLSLGVDVNARTGRVAFRWSWKDRLVGGRLSWSGGEVALTKRFPLGGGGGALSVRGSVDVATGRRALAVAIVPLEVRTFVATAVRGCGRGGGRGNHQERGDGGARDV